jgi:hypothetical protein
MMAGGQEALGVAKWDGSSWSPLGSGTDDFVLSLAVIGSDLYAGGEFTNIGGIAANHIAKWDGNAWSALGSGVNGAVNALTAFGTNLYVAGDFTTAGGSPANRIAKWDGKAWSPLGSGIDYWGIALAVSGNDLYAGGRFTNAGGITANGIAKWDGTGWSVLGSGVSGGNKPSVNALGVSSTELYVGGKFTTAGGKMSTNIARVLLQGASPLILAPVNIVHNANRPDQPFTLSWLATPGLHYQIQTTADLGQPWLPLLATPRLASATVESYDIPGPTLERAFFRVVQLDTAPTAP